VAGARPVARLQSTAHSDIFGLVHLS
jgi:hypothetical protein